MSVHPPQALLTPLPAGVHVTPGTLRAEMDARRASGQAFTIKETLSMCVPLCTQLAALHDEGRRLYVHPSSLDYGGAGLEVLEDAAHDPPSHPRDRACLPPEERKGGEGDSRSSVFSLGAIIYELLTGAPVGPGMKRPVDVIPDLPSELESLLGKALVADPKHRPGDLGALAQALHRIVPGASQAPPPADESHLDHDDTFEVDVSLSLIPPAPLGPHIPPPAASPLLDAANYGVVIKEADGGGEEKVDPTAQLAELKANLESDPRPRYVVIKGGMDHGPFSAVELLQQIASTTFTSDDVLRDTILEDERFIKNWEEFAPFATQTKLNQDIKQEKVALDAVVHAEKKGQQYKTLIGVAIIGLIGAAGLGYWARERANRERELTVHGDDANAIDTDAELGAGEKKRGGGKWAGGGTTPGGGSYPVVAGGKSCESAISSYNEEYKIGGGTGAPDLTAGAYGAVLNKGSYLNSCGVPAHMAVSVCAAVQNGRAVGVSVSTKPSNPGISRCISSQVRGMGFPAHPRMDVARTSFAAQ